MSGLLAASHTSYGFSDEDCALFASKLIENLIICGEDLLDFYDRPQVEHAQGVARDAREYWLKGGNLGDWGSTKEDAALAIKLFPDWVFGE